MTSCDLIIELRGLKHKLSRGRQPNQQINSQNWAAATPHLNLEYVQSQSAVIVKVFVFLVFNLYKSRNVL